MTLRKVPGSIYDITFRAFLYMQNNSNLVIFSGQCASRFPQAIFLTHGSHKQAIEASLDLPKGNAHSYPG